MFCILSRHAWSSKWKDWKVYGIMKIMDMYLKKEGDPENRPLRHPILKTLYYRVKSIYCYKLLSVREVGRKPTIGYISYTIVWKFMKQYVMIYSIKCFLQINKDSTNKHFIIYCLFNIFNKANFNYCMCSRKNFLKSKLFFV